MKAAKAASMSNPSAPSCAKAAPGRRAPMVVASAATPLLASISLRVSSIGDPRFGVELFSTRRPNGRQLGSPRRSDGRRRAKPPGWRRCECRAACIRRDVALYPRHGSPHPPRHARRPALRRRPAGLGPRRRRRRDQQLSPGNAHRPGSLHPDQPGPLHPDRDLLPRQARENSLRVRQGQGGFQGRHGGRRRRLGRGLRPEIEPQPHPLHARPHPALAAPARPAQPRRAGHGAGRHPRRRAAPTSPWSTRARPRRAAW